MCIADRGSYAVSLQRNSKGEIYLRAWGWNSKPEPFYSCLQMEKTVANTWASHLAGGDFFPTITSALNILFLFFFPF